VLTSRNLLIASVLIALTACCGAGIAPTTHESERSLTTGSLEGALKLSRSTATNDVEFTLSLRGRAPRGLTHCIAVSLHRRCTGGREIVLREDWSIPPPPPPPGASGPGLIWCPADGVEFVLHGIIVDPPQATEPGVPHRSVDAEGTYEADRMVFLRGLPSYFDESARPEFARLSAPCSGREYLRVYLDPNEVDHEYVPSEDTLGQLVAIGDWAAVP